MVQDGPGQNQLTEVDCSDLNSFACTKTEGSDVNKFVSFGFFLSLSEIANR